MAGLIARTPRIASRRLTWAGGLGGRRWPVAFPIVHVLGATLIAGCAGRGGFPDLQPRPHEAPRAVAPVVAPADALSAEDRAAFGRARARAEDRLAEVRKAWAQAWPTAQAAVAAARGARPGQPAWAEAQLHLSRLDDALAGYAEVEAILSPLAVRPDARPADWDAERAAVAVLLERVRAEAQAGYRQRRQLERGLD